MGGNNGPPGGCKGNKGGWWPQPKPVPKHVPARPQAPRANASQMMAPGPNLPQEQMQLQMQVRFLQMVVQMQMQMVQQFHSIAIQNGTPGQDFSLQLTPAPLPGYLQPLNRYLFGPLPPGLFPDVQALQAAPANSPPGSAAPTSQATSPVTPTPSPSPSPVAIEIEDEENNDVVAIEDDVEVQERSPKIRRKTSNSSPPVGHEQGAQKYEGQKGGAQVGPVESPQGSDSGSSARRARGSNRKVAKAREA